MTKANGSPRHNPLDDLMGYHLQRTARVMMLELSRRFASVGLATNTASILVVIRANPGITQSELCALTGMKPANATPLVRMLEQCALVQRRDAGRRRLALCTTAQGEQLCAQLEPIMQEFEEAIRRSLGVDDRTSYIAHLRRLGDGFAARATRTQRRRRAAHA